MNATKEFKNSVESLRKLGETGLNHHEDLENLVKFISHCSCTIHWCDHDLEVLGALIQAVAQENERCLKILEKNKCDVLDPGGYPCECTELIAQAIRGKK